MITIDQLTKKYGGTTVVHDITFTARTGRVTGFLGPNGAGKSTSMRMMVGLTTPTAGTRDHLRPPVRRPAQPRARGRRAARRLRPARRPHRPRDPDHRPADPWASRPPGSTRCSSWSASPTTEADRRVGNYSLGMRQRLGIATALIGDPAVLILDEPANGLDPAGIRWMRDLLRDYADQGGTVLLSSHLLHEIEIIADDIVMIGHGRIVAQGTKAELLAAAGTVVRAADVDGPRSGPWPRPASPRPSPRTDRSAPTPTPPVGRARGVRRRRGAHRAPHRRRWRTRGDVPRAHRRHPTREEQRHDRHRHRRRPGPRPVDVPSSSRSRSAGSSASSSARCSTPAPGFWLIASIAITGLHRHDRDHRVRAGRAT